LRENWASWNGEGDESQPMDLGARKEHAALVKERYRTARSKKEVSLILEEYRAGIGQSRKCTVRKLRSREKPDSWPRRKRITIYAGQATAALAKTWEVIDQPSGHRLKPP